MVNLVASSPGSPPLRVGGEPGDETKVKAGNTVTADSISLCVDQKWAITGPVIAITLFQGSIALFFVCKNAGQCGKEAKTYLDSLSLFSHNDLAGIFQKSDALLVPLFLRQIPVYMRYRH